MRVALVIAAAMMLSSYAHAEESGLERFGHDVHFKLDVWSDKYGCKTCHVAGADADKVAPTNGKTHTLCNEADCHAKDFDAYNGKICRTCHLHRTRVPAKAMKMQPFPAEGSFYTEISHKTHQANKVTKRMKDRCLDCHPSRLDETARPGHAQCVACHAEHDKVPMSDCTGCHKALVDEKGQRVITGPRDRFNVCRVTKRFDHAKHSLDRRKGKATRKTSCSTCHHSVGRATTLAQLVPTNGAETMLDGCGQCHNGRDRADSDGKALFSTSGSCLSCHIDRCMTEKSTPSWHRVKE